MNTGLFSTSCFCVLITFISYWGGVSLKKHFRFALFNPLLAAIVFSLVLITLLKITTSDYQTGNETLHFFLTPATICLAIPLYEQISLLRNNLTALLIGIVSGVITNLVLIFLLASAFHLSRTEFITILPKSVTTAIGLSLSEELGGIVSITVLVIAITGVLGSMIGESICRIFHITEPLAQGIGIGTASHVIGTSKALELNPAAGAASSLSISLAGIITVLFSSFTVSLY